MLLELHFGFRDYITFYMIFHIPAFIILIAGLFLLKKKRKTAKTLLIIAGVYLLVGAGICGILAS